MIEYDAMQRTISQSLLMAFALALLVLLNILWLRRSKPVLARFLAFVGGLFAAVWAVAPALPVIVVGGGLLLSWRVFLTRRLTVLSPLLLLSVAAGLRLPGLWLESAWYDETFTAAIAQLPLDRLPAVIASDVHPPLWYLLEWLIVRVFGVSEAALRLPAALFGLLLVWLAYRLALALQLEHKTALATGWLVALLPAFLYYSNEARAYSLLACAVVGAGIAIIKDRPRWFALAALVAMYSHNIGFAYAGLLGLAALAYRPALWRRWLPWLALAGLAGSVWLPVMVSQTHDISNGFWTGTLYSGAVLMPFIELTIGTRIDADLGMLLMVVAFGISGLSVLFSWRWLTAAPGRLLALMVFGVPGVVALLSAVWSNVYLPRAFLGSAVGLCILWARLLVESERGDRRALLAWTGQVILIPLVAYYIAPGRHDMRSLARACNGADVVYSTTVSGAFMAAYHVPDLPLAVWARAGDGNQELPSETLEAFGWALVSNVPDGRVCVIEVDTPLNRPDERTYFANTFADLRQTTIAQNNIFALRAGVK
jgi:hypothetical protein